MKVNYGFVPQLAIIFQRLNKTFVIRKKKNFILIFRHLAMMEITCRFALQPESVFGQGTNYVQLSRHVLSVKKNVFSFEHLQYKQHRGLHHSQKAYLNRLQFLSNLARHLASGNKKLCAFLQTKDEKIIQVSYSSTTANRSVCKDHNYGGILHQLYISVFVLDTKDESSIHVCNMTLKPSLSRSQFMRLRVTRICPHAFLNFFRLSSICNIEIESKQIVPYKYYYCFFVFFLYEDVLASTMLYSFWRGHYF